ncbi:precorrin-8X methylmutase [Kiloniella sp. b19]|uniref:precorrin-8X methylmutase n=1 Tax=Kiloniella sp. GXU_MW_B19 TaxID=3141326 RepID=UPI0031CFDCB9
MQYDYIREPQAIYDESFRQIRAETPALAGMPEDVTDLAVRIVHACGEPKVAEDLGWSDDIVRKGRAALVDGAPVIVDCRMAGDGIIASRLPADNTVLCPLTDERTYAIAKEIGNTRSAAAVELWKPDLEGAVVVIGNAPTALFRLLEILHEGAPKPAAILGFPVGFVGAAESKEALIEAAHFGIPYMTLRGRRGGSAIAAAALNALAKNNQ